MTEVIELLKDQKRLELGHVKAIGETMKGIENPMVKVVLESIVHDSRKHAAIAQALIDVEAGEVPAKLDMDLGPAATLNQSIKLHLSRTTECRSSLIILWKRRRGITSYSRSLAYSSTGTASRWTSTLTCSRST